MNRAQPPRQFEVTAAQIAELVSAELRGEADVIVRRLGPLEDAGPDALTFIRENRWAGQWLSTTAAAVLVSRRVFEAAPANFPQRAGKALLVVDDADLAMIGLLEKLRPPPWAPAQGVHPDAHVEAVDDIGPEVRIAAGATVGPGARIGAASIIYPGVYIGAEVTIGQNCVLHPNVVIYDGCQIGDRVTIHAAAVIGADGFGYVPAADGKSIAKVPHIGVVVVEDDVEIGAGAAIDRGKFGPTVIGAGTKIDNLVQIGHNCRIGRGCIICGTCGIAGSVKIGDRVTLGAGVGVADNVTIGAGATLGARSGVMFDVPEGVVWSGVPARPARQTMRIYSAEATLPELARRVRELEAGRSTAAPTAES